MKIEFIAHAGYCLKTDTTTIMIDPWFYGSTFEQPFVQGILPGSKTIDFQTPRPVVTVQDFKVDAVLLSHYHSHHSPAREIKEMIAQRSDGDPLVLAGPAPRETDAKALTESLTDLKKKVELKLIPAAGATFTVGDCKITCMTHTVPWHFAWLVESPTGSFFHVADSVINSHAMTREMDRFWIGLAGLKPDFFAVSAAMHSQRITRDGRKWIFENSTLSPVEAARLVDLLKPAAAGLMGIFNHSIWMQDQEFTLPAAVAEEYFSWAVQHTSPETKVALMRPGWQADARSLRQVLQPTVTVESAHPKRVA